MFASPCHSLTLSFVSVSLYRSFHPRRSFDHFLVRAQDFGSGKHGTLALLYYSETLGTLWRRCHLTVALAFPSRSAF